MDSKNRILLLICIIALSGCASVKTDRSGNITLDKDLTTETSSRVINHANFLNSYQGCIGEANKPLLTVKLDGKHGKTQKYLKRLQKELNWQLPRKNQVEAITQKILLWDGSEADKVLVIPESDIKRMFYFIRSIPKTERSSRKAYFSTIVWDNPSPSVNYTIHTKCHSIAFVKYGSESSHIDGDMSLKTQAVLGVGLPVGLALNRLLSTERLVRKDYLKFTAKPLSRIASMEERCLSAKSTLREPYKKHLSPEYIRQAQAFCEAVNSDEVEAMKVAYKEFYDETLSILLESGETEVPSDSRYAALFKDHQGSIKRNFRTTRPIEVAAINYDIELRRAYGVAHMADKSSELTAKLSLTLDEVLRAQGRGEHYDYFPYYKLIEWREKKSRESALYDKNALTFYETKALAEKGDSEAQQNLGNMYNTGNGVPENDAESVKWYRKAADQGHADAQSILGLMYVRGAGIPENSIRAYAWWSMAKTQGDTDATENLEILKPQMTKQQIADGQALAAKCYESDYKDCD